MKDLIEKWTKDNDGYIYNTNQCLCCANLISVTEQKCKAYDNIPDDIWNSEKYHTKVFEGQTKEFIFEKMN